MKWYQSIVQSLDEPLKEAQTPKNFKERVQLLLMPLVVVGLVGLMWLFSHPHAHLLGETSGGLRRGLSFLPTNALVRPWEYMRDADIWVNVIWRALLCLAWYPLLLMFTWLPFVFAVVMTPPCVSYALTRNRTVYWMLNAVVWAGLLYCFGLWYGPALVVAIWRVPVLYLLLIGAVIQHFMPEDHVASTGRRETPNPAANIQEPQLAESDKQDATENRESGERAFREKDYRAAIQFLEQIPEAHRSRVDNAKLGYARKQV